MVERVQVSAVVWWRLGLLGVGVAWCAGMIFWVGAQVPDNEATVALFTVWSAMLLGPPVAVRNRRSFPAVCAVIASVDLSVGFLFAMVGLFVFWPLVLPLIIAAFLPASPGRGQVGGPCRVVPASGESVTTERWVSVAPKIILLCLLAIPVGLIVAVLVAWARR